MSHAPSAALPLPWPGVGRAPHRPGAGHIRCRRSSSPAWSTIVTTRAI